MADFQITARRQFFCVWKKLETVAQIVLEEAKKITCLAKDLLF